MNGRYFVPMVTMLTGVAGWVVFAIWVAADADGAIGAPWVATVVSFLLGGMIVFSGFS